jgi:DNA-binding NtrC family response regulator
MNDKTAFSILIVDDEEFVRHLLSSFLGAKYDCLTAENAKQALATMERTHVDLVVTDIMMPGISGLELCDTVRQRYPQTRTVVISALGDAPSRQAARERGAFDFIEKPFDLNLILSVVDRALTAFTPHAAVGEAQ